MLSKSRVHLVVLPLILALAACDLSVGNLTERVTEEWIRSYPLSAGGEIRIGNTNEQVAELHLRVAAQADIERPLYDSGAAGAIAHGGPQPVLPGQ